MTNCLRTFDKKVDNRENQSWVKARHGSANSTKITTTTTITTKLQFEILAVFECFIESIIHFESKIGFTMYKLSIKIAY